MVKVDMFLRVITQKCALKGCRYFVQYRTYSLLPPNLIYTNTYFESFRNECRPSCWYFKPSIPYFLSKNRSILSLKQYNQKLVLHGKNSFRYYCKESGETKKLSVFQRFKKLYKESWHVLIPVHIVTSTFWFTSFYYLAKSGVDLVSLAEIFGAGEKLTEKMKNGHSTTGYIAIAYLMYKIMTPIRYAVTIGGTGLSIKYLRKLGYLKPKVPKNSS